MMSQILLYGGSSTKFAIATFFLILLFFMSTVGQNANANWRAVPMSDLRLHPYFRPLPPTSAVNPTTASSAGLYRQDSWQWDMLHSGRLTTSKMACCLGIYEGYAASHLEIPRSLQSHARSSAAWQQLLRKPITDFRELRDTSHGVLPPAVASPWESAAGDMDHGFPFYYNAIETAHELPIYKTPSSARLAWGSAQEATAVLAVMNYFARGGSGVTVQESGMFTLEALAESLPHRQYLDQQHVLREILGAMPRPQSVPSLPCPPPPPPPPPATGKAAARAGPKAKQKQPAAAATITAENLYDAVQRCTFSDRSLPLLGASPDGIIQHADGRVEVLEVKCVSPFISVPTGKAAAQATAEGSSAAASAKDSMTIVGGFSRSAPGSKIKAGFGVWHMPQLQLEMFCVGAHCRSAVMAILSVTGLRLYRVERDDEYIACMMELVRKFYTQYISRVPSNKRRPPPPNFFNPRSDPYYADFLQRTIALAESATLIAELGNPEIQRSPHNDAFFL